MSRRPIAAALAVTVVALVSFVTVGNAGKARPALRSTPQVVLPLDHFNCYEVKGAKEVKRTVLLSDQFGREQVVTKKPQRFCNPVDKLVDGTRTPITNPLAHLKCYGIEDVKNEDFPKFTKVVVTVRNQFGDDVLKIEKPKMLCTPASKSTTGQDPGPLPAAAQIDHFKCYEAHEVKPDGTDNEAFTPVEAVLTDQFGTENVTVVKPKILCNPVEKRFADTVTPINDPLAHLVCYEIKPEVKVSREVAARDQFGLEALTLEKSVTLCVPSLKFIGPAPTACQGVTDRCIDADGIASRFDGLPGAADVTVGTPLASFPDGPATSSGLDLFDRDGNQMWTFGPAGDDLHAEDPSFCPGAIRNGVHEAVDCLVLDINGDLAPGTPVWCDLEVGAFSCVGFIPQIKYHDMNGNGSWDSGEDIVLDGNLDGIFD